MTAIKAAAVTKAMRGLVPQATMSTAAGKYPGQFTIRVPVTTANHLGLLSRQSGREFVGSYLARRLGAVVRITSVQATRPTATSSGTVAIGIQLS